MPTKMATCCKEKAVFVTVYVERPGKKTVPESQHHHHHHHHHYHLHQTIKREVIVHNRGASSNGYDRRAQLLQYSQHLRASALSAAKSPSPSPLNSSSSGNKKPESQVVDVERKSKRPGTPATIGSLKILIANFFRSFTRSGDVKERKQKKHSGSMGQTTKAITKSLEMPERKRWFIPICCSPSQKHN